MCRVYQSNCYLLEIVGDHSSDMQVHQHNFTGGTQMRHHENDDSIALSFREDTNLASRLNVEALDLMLRRTTESCPSPGQPGKQSLAELINAKSNSHRNEDNMPAMIRGSVLPFTGTKQESPGDHLPAPASPRGQFEGQFIQKIEAPGKLGTTDEEMENYAKAIKKADDSIRVEQLKLIKRLESGTPMTPMEMRAEAVLLKEAASGAVKVRLEYYDRLRKHIELYDEKAKEPSPSAFSDPYNLTKVTNEFHKVIREISDMHPNAHDNPQFAKDAKQAGVLKPSKK